MVLPFKEPADIVYHAFEALTRGCILLELEIASFLPIIFKLFFSETFSCFYPHF